MILGFSLFLLRALAASVAAPVVPVYDVFNKGESGYYCIKIPYITSLPDGSLFALGEARKGAAGQEGCSDYTKTDLVLKRSADGRNWSDLEVFHSGEGPVDTAGNAAPIVVNNTDIVVLFNLNNSKVLMKRSRDLGKTWTEATDVSESTTHPTWKWVGLGPPSGIKLSSGRLLIPAYHTTIFPPGVDNGLISKGHALLSDDDGFTWRISADDNFGGKFMPNEDQAVELSGGRVAIFARGFGFERTRTESPDGGEHWGSTELVNLKEPFSGCEGSTIECPNGRLVFSGPTSMPLFRKNMSIWVSDDEGHTWHDFMVVDPGCAAYSALAFHGDELGLLYERCDHLEIIFEPQHISYAPLPNPCNATRFTSATLI